MSSDAVLRDAVHAALAGLGVESGDTVFMHSDAIAVRSF